MTIPFGIETIGGDAFCNFGNVTSVTIPVTVVTILDRAFTQTDLTYVDLCQVINIGDQAFDFCVHLTEVKFPTNDYVIGKHSFCGTSLVDADLSMCSSLDEGAFSACTKLQTVTFSDKLKKIPARCFRGTKIRALTMTDNITEIGEQAFEDAGDLKVVFTSCNLVTIGNYAFYRSAISAVHLPDTMRVVGAYAFSGCVDLVDFESLSPSLEYRKKSMQGTSIKSTGAISNVGDMAFSYCTSLEKVPTLKTSPPIRAFAGTNLTYVCFAKGVERVGTQAFIHCVNLKSVTLSSTMVSIGEAAFAFCGVRKMTFPEKLGAVLSMAFHGCDRLTKVEGLNAKLIGECAFTGTALKEVQIPIDAHYMNAFSRHVAVTHF